MSTYSALYGTGRYDQSYYGVIVKNLTADALIYRPSIACAINVKIRRNSFVVKIS